jgi:4-alpha-glucanotransferase
MSMPELPLREYLQGKYSKDKWDRIGSYKRAGVVAPLFSLYSSQSVGIGEFDDLRLLVDWCVKAGNSIIQLLPLNECGPTFCPYDSVSSFALEPSYLALRFLSAAKDKGIQRKIEEMRQRYPGGLAQVDYGIKQAKVNLLREIYLEEDLNEAQGFADFVEENNYWLGDFGMYMVLKAHHGLRPWHEWQPEYRDHDDAALEAFYKEHERAIVFHIWLQWQLYKQFKTVKDYAASKGVFIKGDLPILVSRDSADVWAHPEFFKLEFSAGAPPDMYCAKGQRWGMPTYNWDAIAADGYCYVKEKLRYAQNFYDLLRIDHVVGLFRIWSIRHNDPAENQGLYGFFDPYDEHRWEEQGKRLLSLMLDNANMLLCAEDLGTIPGSCIRTLEELGIPGNDVQRWTKEWEKQHDFLKPEEYRRLSVAMLSTHDTTNWAAWWENEAGTVDQGLFMRWCVQRGIHYDDVKEKLFDFSRCRHGRLRWRESLATIEMLAEILGKKKEELKDFIGLYQNSYHEKEKLWVLLKLRGPMREKSDAAIVEAALKYTLQSQAIFCLQLITDWLYLSGAFKGDAYQYRINTPGTTSPANWSLTMPFSLEELLKHKITRQIRGMVAKSGRQHK